MKIKVGLEQERGDEAHIINTLWEIGDEFRSKLSSS